MFVKATNGTVGQYPYTVGDLRRDHPNTSFPKQVPESLMADFDMYPVGYEAAPDHDPMIQRIQHSSQPVLKDGKWVLTKTVVELTQEQIDQRNDSKAKDVRRKRDELIVDTDWMALSDNTLTPEWATYRQALRDITDHARFPWLNDEDWPVKPE